MAFKVPFPPKVSYDSMKTATPPSPPVGLGQKPLHRHLPAAKTELQDRQSPGEIQVHPLGRC